MLLEDLEKTVISYFDYKIIALYKAESEKYIVKSDFFQGRVCSNPEYIQSPEFEDNNYIDIRFGYRTLKDGSLAVAAWLPDLFEKSKTHVKMWSGLHLENPEWTSDHDERFKSWTKRNLEGSWEVENGPFYQIQEVVENINAITFEYVGYKLFKFELENSISFPSAENDHRYEDSHKELYGYLIDGINKDCISEIAKRSRIEIRIASKNTINSLQSLFPNLEY